MTILGIRSAWAGPNNSFKPNLLRYTKAMAEKACHGFGSTTQVGLTQALGGCCGGFCIGSRLLTVRFSSDDRLRPVLLRLAHCVWSSSLRLRGSTCSRSRNHLRQLRLHGAPGVPGRAPVPADWYCFGWRRCFGAWHWRVRQHPRQHRLTSHSSRTRQVASA